MDSRRRPNVLLFTLDQFRGDCLSSAGHPVVRTPHLDRLAAEGVRFARHYSQAAPCGPGRASLYTGMYQLNHRVVANGTPLDRRFDNVALAARRAGYAPTLFGYTDQSIDPRDAAGPDDPRLSRYTGILPGFDVELDLPDEHEPWLEWLESLGYDVSAGPSVLLSTEHERPEEHSVGAFVTDTVIDWIGHQTGPWFAHVSHLRPHPPYSAPGEWSTAYPADAVGEPLPPAGERSPFHEFALSIGVAAAPADPARASRMRTQYFGMVSHIDHQLGRVWNALERFGQWDDTLVVVTADHGDMLGDHGLKGKLGYWEQSYWIPCIVRDPTHPDGHGSVVERFTENVDVLPTICAAIGAPVPPQCDGDPLTAFLRGESPADWRNGAHWEFDWREHLIRSGIEGRDRALERQHLATLRTDTHAYVQFGDGSWLCFDLVADPTWRTTTRRRCCRWRRRCSCGGHGTPIARWPTSSANAAASGAGPRGRPTGPAEGPAMLLATIYALTAAVLHAGWNLFAKRSVDPFLALWGQFLLAGGVSAIVLAATGGLPAEAWAWAAVSGGFHIPYVVALAWAYHHGDFSLAYPLARGGGALLAALGGLILLGDSLSPLSLVAIVVVVGGMTLLAGGADRAQVIAALIVAVAIGGYTLADSHAARELDTFRYVFATQTVTAATVSAAGLAMGRGGDLLRVPRLSWLKMLGAAAMTIGAYGLVLVAVRRAPVGYVAALRESSVLIAVFVGARYLGEGRGRVRAVAAGLIVSGLTLLVVAR